MKQMLLSIRKLPCRIERLFRESSVIPNFSYFNPSSAYPYIYIRATEQIEDTENEKFVQMSYMFLYSYKTDKMYMIDIPSNCLLVSYNYHQGIEDTRLLMYKNRLWFVSTSTHISPSMRSEMLLGYFTKDTSRIEFYQHLDFGIRPLKNLCPFSYKDELYLLDAYTLNIYKIIQDSISSLYIPQKHITLIPCKNISYHTMRGSTSPLFLHGNLFGCIVHEHIPKATGGAFAYISYWMEFDIVRGVITFISEPFYISCFGIEFISGMEYDREKDVIEIYLGFQDEVPLVAYTTLHALRVG